MTKPETQQFTNSTWWASILVKGIKPSVIVSVTQVPRAKQTIREPASNNGSRGWKWENMISSVIVHHRESSCFLERTQGGVLKRRQRQEDNHCMSQKGMAADSREMRCLKGRKNILFGSSSKNTRAFLIVVMPFFIIYRQQSFVERLHNSESFNLKFLVKTKK